MPENHNTSAHTQQAVFSSGSDRHSKPFLTNGLPNLDALKIWARKTAKPFDLVEEVIVYRAMPAPNRFPDRTDPIRYVMAENCNLRTYRVRKTRCSSFCQTPGSCESVVQGFSPAEAW